MVISFWGEFGFDNEVNIEENEIEMCVRDKFLVIWFDYLG